jgi:trimeric autotransporter adhesin
MRAFILAVTGLAFSVAACSSYGTSVVEVKNAAHVASVAVVLPSPSLLAGQTQRGTATVKDSSGASLPDKPVTWSTSSAAVATVTDSGLIRAVAPGTAVVSAVSEGVSGQTTMTVMSPPPVAVARVLVAINPAAVLVGQSTHATAMVQDANGNTLTDRTVTFQSANTNVATVSASGDISAVGAGSTFITGTSEGVSGSASVTVNTPAAIPVATVGVSPPTSSLQVGATVQLSATTLDANNNVLTGRVVAWSSANTSIATVNSSGLVTAVGAGSVQVTASSEGKSGSSSVTVTAPPPVPVATVIVSPSAPSIAVGATTQLSASTRDANNNVLTGRVVTWSTGNATIASVSTSGLVTAVAAGTTQITATSEGKAGTATVTVTAAAPPPPPPSGSNEPSGLTLIADRPFNSTTATYTEGEAGWFDSDNGALAIVQDATAPRSPSNVARMTFNAGIDGGFAPSTLEHPVNATTIYVAAWVQFSSNWQSHSSGVNKILHLWIGGGNHVVITAAGLDYTGSSPLTARISLQGISGGCNNSDGSGTYESSVQFIRGQWHKIEVVAIANTAGTNNGSVKLYVDGALATQCSGINFGGTAWSLVSWAPVWGGTGDVLAATQYEYMDHIYLSGK